MEYFGLIGFVLAVLAYYKAETSAARLKKLETMLKEEGWVDKEKEALREILQKNKGRVVRLSLSSDAMDFDINDKDCVLQDIDEVWLRVKTVKKQEEYLVRVESVESVDFAGDEK